MDSVRKPSVLFAYYTYTQQSLKVVEAMADVLRSRGCEVHLAAIEFIDPRYAKRFAVFHAASVSGGRGDDPGRTSAPSGKDPSPPMS